MKRYATETEQHDPRTPLPPVFSRLSAGGSGILRGAPARPYFGPAGPPQRRPKEGAAEPGRAGRGAPDQQASPHGTPHPGARDSTITIPHVPDRTAAHGTPLPAQPDDDRGAPRPAPATRPARSAATEQGRAAAGPGSEPAARLAEQVADRLERLALRLRTHGDPRLAIATDTGEPLDSIIARIIGDHLRDEGA